MTTDEIVQIWFAADELANGDSLEAAQMLIRAAAFASVEAGADPMAIKADYDRTLELAQAAAGCMGAMQ